LYTTLDKKREERVYLYLIILIPFKIIMKPGRNYPLKNDISMDKVFKIAEKVDRLSVGSNNINTYSIDNLQHKTK